MLRHVASLIGRVGLSVFEAVSGNTWRSLPHPPSGVAIARADGHDPDRVLLAGGSSAVGLGVLGHDLALAGFLARSTAAITGRGVDVEVFADPRMTAAMIRDRLDPVTISRYDAIVLTIGTREAFSLTPTDRWVDQLTGLLDRIIAGRDAGPSILIVGAEEVEPVPLPGFVSRLVRGRARAINQATRAAILGRPRIRFVDSAWIPVAPARNLVDADKPSLYDRSATALAPALAGLLDESPDRVRHPVDEESREKAVAFLRSRLDRPDPRVDALLTTVRDVMHVRSVDLFFVDRNDVYLLSATTRSVGSKPRGETLSTEALEYWGGLVVRDLAADPAHASRPEVTGPPYLRFYAGYPVESPEGRRVAVLTIVDTEPRDISPSELSLLRHFALRVGSLLFEQYRP